jgi:hypothetical protein
MSRLSIFQLLQSGIRRGGEARLGLFDLAPLGRNAGVYMAGDSHERRQELIVRAGLFQVLMRIQSFARDKLDKWKKDDESVSLSGPTIRVVYKYEYAESFALQPKTFRARWNKCAERQKTRKNSIVRRVPYEIELRVEIEQQSQGAVRLAVCMSEAIDRKGQLADYPIGHHFWAPSVIHTEPWFDDFLAAVQ